MIFFYQDQQHNPSRNNLSLHKLIVQIQNKHFFIFGVPF